MKARKLILDTTTRFTSSDSDGRQVMLTVGQLISLWLNTRVQYRTVPDMWLGQKLAEKLAAANRDVLFEANELQELSRLLDTVPRVGLYALELDKALRDAEEVEVEEAKKDG
mgnify:CR=1 FL=1